MKMTLFFIDQNIFNHIFICPYRSKSIVIVWLNSMFLSNFIKKSPEMTKKWRISAVFDGFLRQKTSKIGAFLFLVWVCGYVGDGAEYILYGTYFLCMLINYT